MATRVERRRFSVHDYHRMAEAGILSEDDRVELLTAAHRGETLVSPAFPTLALGIDDLLG
jgi:hypothetical protein